MDDVEAERFTSEMEGQEHLVRVPMDEDRVHRDECAYSFDSPFSPDGLYVNLRTWIAVGSDYLWMDHQRSGGKIYLRIKHSKVPKREETKKDEEGIVQDDVPTKLALGVQGGFQDDAEAWELKKEHSLVLMPEGWRMSYSSDKIPKRIVDCIESILSHDEALDEKDVATWQEEILPSKYAAGLVQLKIDKKISPDPNTWECEESGSKENLWLNLSTGFIGSGRRNWDGSGGNGAALRHFEQTGKQYPLVVKLGTITPRGADVFSYADDENDMVEDPYLAEHLAHWGIDIMCMEKTEKTMTELQIDLNKSFEFDKITEAGADLKPLKGAGYMGLRNLGNTCYMNSVLQILFALPEFEKTYSASSEIIFASSSEDPTSDFHTQMAKLGLALCSDRYAYMNLQETFKSGGLEPRMFKHLIGRNHSEFSSNRQQDAVEFFQYLLEIAEATQDTSISGECSGAAHQMMSRLFTFSLEDRLQDMQCGKVNYLIRKENVLSLGIPMKMATNLEDVERFKERESKRQRLKSENAEAYIGSEESTLKESEEAVVPNVPFDACLKQFLETESIDGFLSPVTEKRGIAEKKVGFKTFPPYLVVQMRRYYIDEHWTPRKLDVLVEAPEELDLEHMRSSGLQSGEELLPDIQEPMNAAETDPVPDETIVAQLMSMGFSENSSKRAALATDNASMEASMEWIFAHMEDPDFNEPLSTSAVSPTPEANPEAVAMLASMGFTDDQAKAALIVSGQSIDRAADWLFSHSDDLGAAVQAVLKGDSGDMEKAPSSPSLSDGVGRYQLVGFISHVGKDTGCGHYVCHIKKEGRWVIYNDEKVAISEHPPLSLGYAYMYRRCDWPA